VQKSAKKRKRVRKNMKRKGIVLREWMIKILKGATPHYMHEYQKKRLTEIAIRN
jgi:hypothetical protein